MHHPPHAARLFLLAPALAASSVLAGPPATDKQPVADTYHGAAISEDYRWLENWDDPKVKAWSEAQNAYARSVLDVLPSVKDIRARLTTLETGASAEFFHLHEEGGKLFALKNQPPKQQPMLVALKTVDDPASARIIVDPNAIDSTGSTTIDWFVPSKDGRLLAVSLSSGGDESGTVHVYDAATGRELGQNDIIPRAHGGTAGGSLAWDKDGKGFYYTRYPRPGDRPEADLNFYVQVYHHTLGQDPATDEYIIGKDFVRIAEVVIETSEDGQYLLVSVQNGDGGEFEHHLRGPERKWARLSSFKDKIVEANFGPGALYLVSRQDAPRGTVLRLALDGATTPGVAAAKEIIPQAEGSIATDFFSNAGIHASDSRLFVLYQAGGPNELKLFGLDGKPLGEVPLPPVSAVNELVHTHGDQVLIAGESFITPPAWFAYDGASGSMERTGLFQTSPADFSDCEVVREFATSKDGAKVPISIIRPKGAKLDGQNPTVLWGYGGYGVSESPSFSPRRALFIEQGGVFAIANIRGGGEYGEEWHRAGNLTNKQNVFDDFYACAKHLIDRGYTSKDKLALMGGSNGGLLMGAMITQHPDLCRAVVSSVGIYDMLRVELSPNGAFNVTEFGTVKDPAQFKALAAYSPYHHVKDGTDYPAILMLTGANDPRVDPMHSRKMIARLQAAEPGGTFLLRTSANAGHGVGSSLAQRIEQSVDIYAFLFGELGVTYKPVK